MNIIKALLKTIIQVTLGVALFAATILGLSFGITWVLNHPDDFILLLGIIVFGFIVILLFFHNLNEMSSKGDKRKGKNPRDKEKNECAK